MTAAILYDQQDDIVTITLNRPEALNSINRQLRQELNEAMARFDRDDSARVAIITGAGRAFCAGRDLKERAADNAAGVQARAADRRYQRLCYGRRLGHRADVRPADSRRERHDGHY